MKNVTIENYIDYREYLNDYISSLPKGGRGQLKKIAEYLNVHSTFVSQVFNGLKDFSSEQAYQLCEYLSLTAKETDYFLVLLQMNRAGTEKLTTYYNEKLKVLRSKLGQVKEKVGASSDLSKQASMQYYSNWRYAAIWLATFFENLNSIEEIANFLSIPRKEVREIIDFLLAENLCIENEKGINPTSKRIHVSKGSPDLRSHLLNWRLKSLEFVNLVRDDELAFTAPISLSKADFKKIKGMILEYISEISEIVEDSPSETIACLNIDFFNL